MSTDSNPYAPPASAPYAAAEPVRSAMRRVMVRWELLRVVYCGVLVPFVLLVSFALQPAAAGTLSYWGAVAVGGIVANLCYLVGPAMEVYAVALGIAHPLVCVVLFLAGTFLTAGLAVMCIAGYA